MNREEELFQKRLLDLATAADRRGIVTFTDFLNLNELNIFHQTLRELAFVTCRSFGGYEHAERQIISFIPDALSYGGIPEEEFPQALGFPYPIACVKITPLHEKYAEKLGHRDYLGALMNLGIERGTTGDILIQEHQAWLFCLEKMADFLCRELTRVRNTPVQAILADLGQIDYHPSLEKVRGSVASVRLDSLLALAFQSSRSSLVGLIEGGKVFVNGKLITSNGYRLQEQDLVSARGLGRFRYNGILSQTRKGRIMIELEKFV